MKEKVLVSLIYLVSVPLFLGLILASITKNQGWVKLYLKSSCSYVEDHQ